jgi:putative ABC transport system permease protein
MISAFTVVKQLKYMQTRDLGIDHEQMVTFTLRGDRFQGGIEAVTSSKRAFENELLKNPSVLGITYFNQLPGKITNTSTLILQDNNVGVPYKVINTDPGFVPLMGLEVIEGRAQSFDIISDMNDTYLINEEAVKQFELNNPVGSRIHDGRITIIGVVKNFHYNSLHSKIDPLAIRWNYWPSRACVKIAGADIKNTLDYIDTIYRRFCPGFNLEYTFLDESFARQYQAEQRLEILVELFVLLAICLSCLGLFALSAIITKQKTQEIGIRKALGSSNNGIIIHISKGFLLWVILANMLSWPLAYLVLKKWLQGFAYHLHIGVAVFILSALLAFLIAFLTIFGQALKASMANPADCLRYE